MKLKLTYSAASGERVAEGVYLPQRGEVVPLPDTDDKATVRSVKRTPAEGPPRKVEIELTVKPKRKGRPFRALPGLSP